MKDNQNCEVRVATVDSLASIVKTNTWSPIVFKDNKRRSENFMAAEVVGLDIDSGMSLEAALQAFQGYKHIIGTTRNHRKEKNGVTADRFRVILFPEEPMYNPEYYDFTWKTLKSQYPIDIQTKDRARIFYPCHEIVSVNATGLMLPVTYEDPNVRVVNRSSASSSKNKKTLPAWVVDALQNPPENGNWHNTFIKVWKAFKAANYSQEEAINFSSKFISLDQKDLQQIDYAYGNFRFEMELSDLDVPDKLSPHQYTAVMDSVFNQILKNDYYVMADPKGSRRLLSRSPGNEVAVVSSEHALSRVIQKLKGSPLYRSLQNVRSAFETWMYGTELLEEEPATVAFKGTTCPTFHRLEFDPEPGECPNFNSIIDNINNGEALCAFIWSLFEPQSYKQQAVWWYGLGMDGKGTISQMLEWMLGTACLATSSDDYKSNKSFFFESLVGKRIVIFSDENNRKLFMSGWFKRLSGDDSVLINPKGEKPYNARLNLKLMVHSNHEPDFDNTNAHLRRVIYCSPKGSNNRSVDPKFADKIKAELPQILFKCREYYNKLVINHGPIQSDDLSARALGDESEIYKNDFFDKFFEVDEEGVIARIDLQRFIQDSIYSNNFNYKDFKHYLKVKYGIYDKRMIVDDVRLWAFPGIKFRKGAGNENNS